MSVFETRWIEWGVAGRSFDGRGESGDQYLIESFPPSTLVAVVDGLGHGRNAATAARSAIAVLEGHAQEPLAQLFKRCHERLRGSRGVVMSLASFNGLAGTMEWLGVGNVRGVFLRANGKGDPTRERLLLRGGVIGYRLPPLRPVTVPIRSGDVLAFATDGLRSGFAEGSSLDGSPQEIADRILTQYGRGTDDALVVVARFVGETRPQGNPPLPSRNRPSAKPSKTIQTSA